MSVHAQFGSCELAFEACKDLYNRGNFKQIQDTLSKYCLGEEPTSRSYKRESYRLLANTFIALDDLEAADSVYSELVKLYPTFNPDENLGDLPELTWLGERYNTSPTLHIMLTLGVLNTAATEITPYERSDFIRKINNEDTSQSYKRLAWTPTVGLHVGKPIGEFFDIRAGLELRSMRYNHTYNFRTNGLIEYGKEGNSCSGTGWFEMDERLRYLSIPITVSVFPLRNDNYVGKSKWRVLPYISVGVSFNRLLDQKVNEFSSGLFAEGNNIKCPETGFFNEVPSDQIGNIRKDWVSMIEGAIGLKVKIEEHHLFAEASYSGSFGQVNESYQETDPDRVGEILSSIYYVDNDFRLSAVAFRFGAAYSFYKPRLKKEYR